MKHKLILAILVFIYPALLRCEIDFKPLSSQNLSLKKIVSKYPSSYQMGNILRSDKKAAAAWFAVAQAEGFKKAEDAWSDCVGRMSVYELEKSQSLAEEFATKHLKDQLENPEVLRPVFTGQLVREIKLKIYDELAPAPSQFFIPRDKFALYAKPKESAKVSFASFDTCLKTAQDGFAEAQFELSERYEQGDGILKNEAEARKWIISSAKQGYMPAIKKSGILKYAFQLHKQGDLDATYYLADHTYSGPRNSMPDTSPFYGEYVSTYNSSRSEHSDFFAYYDLTRIDFLTIAAKGGHADAKYDLGIYFLKNADYENAYYQFGLSATDNPDSALLAGFLRGMGWGCGKNHTAGFLSLLSAYKNIKGRNSDFTPEMYSLAESSMSKNPQLNEVLWYQCLNRISNVDRFGGIPLDRFQIPDLAQGEKVRVLWESLLDLEQSLTKETIAKLKSLAACGVDAAETVSLAQKALEEREIAKERITSQIKDIRSIIEAKYIAAIDVKKVENDKNRAEEAARQKRYREQHRKESIFSLSMIGIGIVGLMGFLYGIYRAIRKVINWRQANPREKKPLRNWKKVLSGWILWGVLVGLYAVFFEEVSVGVVFYPPLAATIAFIWWQWIKASNARNIPSE